MKTPVGLRPATREWFESVVAEWELEEHHIRLLTVAAQAFDEAAEATRLVHKEGLVVTMPSGAQRPHPALRIANEARAVFVRALRELDLDVGVAALAKRPPSLRSIAGGRS